MTVDTSGSWIHKVEVVVRHRRELLRRFLSEAPHGGLMVTVSEPLGVGELVELGLTIEDPGELHRIRGAVLWSRRSHSNHYTVGIGFLSTEVDKRERLLKSPAPCPENPVERRETRYTTTLKVTYRNANDFVVDYTRNISTGGIFVDNPNPPEVGTRIMFRLFPPGQEKPIELAGQVAWKRAGQGFGARFTPETELARKELARLVRILAVGAAEPVRERVVEEVIT